MSRENTTISVERKWVSYLPNEVVDGSFNSVEVRIAQWVLNSILEDDGLSGIFDKEGAYVLFKDDLAFRVRQIDESTYYFQYYFDKGGKRRGLAFGLDKDGMLLPRDIEYKRAIQYFKHD